MRSWPEKIGATSRWIFTRLCSRTSPIGRHALILTLCRKGFCPVTLRLSRQGTSEYNRKVQKFLNGDRLFLMGEVQTLANASLFVWYKLPVPVHQFPVPLSREFR